MDPYEDAPAVAALVALHKPAAVAPESREPSWLPAWLSGDRMFDSLDDVIRVVRELHEVSDYVVAPHKSKYEARVIMQDVLEQLKPLITNANGNYSAAEVQWLREQAGRISYLNGVNHIEAEETSAGEKMLSKAMLTFKDAMQTYPFDIMDGYNHLGIVWSNRSQHGVSHAYLNQAQQAFLVFKKLRASALEALTAEERAEIARRDRLEQEAEAPVEEPDPIVLKKAAEAAAAAKAKLAAEAAKADGATTEGKQSEAEQKAQEAAQSTTAVSPVAATPAVSAASASASSADPAAPAPRPTHPPLALSLPPSHSGYRFLDPVLWHSLEVTHTLTLFFLAQVFGHLKKRDLAAIYCHLVLNRQLKQRKDFNRREWVTNAIGLSFYYSGRKLLKQAHHCLLAASHFIPEASMPRQMNTPTRDTTKDEQLAADLCRAWGAFYLKWLQRSRDQFIEGEQLLPIDDQTAAGEAALAAKAGAAALASSPAGTAAAPSTSSGAVPAAAAGDDDEAADASTNLASLPPAELAELKRLQRLDRDRERHFENQAEEEADEDEEDLFGDLRSKMHKKLKDAPEGEGKIRKIDRTLPSALTKEESEAVREELKKNVEDNEASEAASAAADSNSNATVAAASSSPATASAAAAPSAASSAPMASSSTHLLIEFKSLHLPASPACVYATSFASAKVLWKSATDWFHRASLFYILDGYVSDHIPIQQDLSLAYKLLAVFDMDLSRQCKMHKRRLDLLHPIYTSLSVASYQEFFQQLTDELATICTEMMDLKLFILQMKTRLLSPKVFTPKKQQAAWAKINELALKAVQYYQIWCSSWSKDGKPPKELDEYYQRWYLMAMFKQARCYSKIYHSEPQVLNQFIKKSLDAYTAVVAQAEAWGPSAVRCMAEELPLCREMMQLLPIKMDRVVAKGGFRV